MTKKIKFNKSKTYLLPLLSEIVNLNTEFIPYLNNTYLCDNQNRYENCFYILHNFNVSDPKFTSYEHELINNELFVDMYDINDQVLYVFQFPVEYLVEYNAFKNSKYSEFGSDAKELVLEFWAKVYRKNPNILPFLTKVKSILFKEKQLKKKLEHELNIEIDNNAELGDLISIENEMFNFEVLQNIKNDKNKNTEVW
jgi:hypothetical protein